MVSKSNTKNTDLVDDVLGEHLDGVLDWYSGEVRLVSGAVVVGQLDQLMVGDTAERLGQLLQNHRVLNEWVIKLMSL